jgi:AcrR family transcriptional regulator
MGRPPAGGHEKYDAILAAALRLFVERGYDGTAVPEIARAANVAAGTIYHYFPSKVALVNVLYRRWKDEVARRVYAAFPPGASPRAQFAGIWRVMATFAAEHRDAFAFLELQARSRRPGTSPRRSPTWSTVCTAATPPRSCSASPVGQDLHRRQRHRRDPAADLIMATTRPGRPALRRVQGAVPRQRRRVLRQLLRLLPARGVRPPPTPSSRRTRSSTKRSTGCATPRPSRC